MTHITTTARAQPTCIHTLFDWTIVVVVGSIRSVQVGDLTTDLDLAEGACLFT